MEEYIICIQSRKKPHRLNQGGVARERVMMWLGPRVES
jgi:hypothetical protein